MTRYPDYLYNQEPVLFSSACSCCVTMGKMTCDFNDIGDIDWHKKDYHWTTDIFLIKVKVNAIGQVAMVHEPEDYVYLHPHM